MSLQFSFVSQAPAVKVSDLASYRACLVEYEIHVARMAALYGSPNLKPSVPSISLPALKAKGDKGEWETAWLKLCGRKSVRMTDSVKATYGDDKEAYCKDLVSGDRQENEEEEEVGESPAPNFSAEEVVGLH